MFTKALAIKEMDEKGVGLALLATLSDVDHDGDTYAKGAFAWAGDGQWAPIIPAHNWSHMPFGKGRVFEEGDEALAELKLNMDTAAGRDWHSALKFDLSTGQPVQQWSYGYDAEEYSNETRGGQKVRVLEKVRVMEVSPVIRGAGKRTGTRSMKGVSLKEADFTATLEQLQEMAAMIDANPELLSATGVKQAKDIRATLDAMIAAKERPSTGSASDGGGNGDGGVGDRAVAAFLFRSVKRHLPQN
jgi:hypothetical protein